jgi:protein-S-isoprenylcysteine O-methyltransferase Ste14
MKDLNKRAFAGLLGLLLSMGACIFLPAWTFHYWQAWIFLAAFNASALLITLYLMKNDSRLLQARVNAGPNAEKEKSQKILQSALRIAFIGTLIIPALDHRFAWSKVPPYISVVGDLLVLLGFQIVFLVFKENTFTSGIIEVRPGQKVISTGPYALVRHPMYSGALIMLAAIPLALASWWALLIVILLAAGIVLRLLDEEQFLDKNLPAYPAYRHKVRHRLIPFIW